MVGEIRDEETAEMACRAALVGRLVLSTLHTGSAEEAVPRLIDLGVPEYLVQDVVVGVLAQELVARGESSVEGSHLERALRTQLLQRGSSKDV